MFSFGLYEKCMVSQGCLGMFAYDQYGKYIFVGLSFGIFGYFGYYGLP